MLTESVNARKDQFYDLIGNDMEPQHGLDSSSSSSSSAVQDYSINHIPTDNYFNSIRDLKTNQC